MGKVYGSIDAKVRRWIDKQQIFFVATSPLAADGHVNLSPKGHDTLRVLDERTVAFLDYGGSGVETIAHLRENRRIVIMMCAFTGPPRIFRFHGTGSVVMPNDREFSALAAHFDRSQLGVRSIISVEVTRIADSCGFGVPFYNYVGQRSTSPDYMRKHGADCIRDYLEDVNPRSIDDLPGITADEAQAFEPPLD